MSAASRTGASQLHSTSLSDVAEQMELGLSTPVPIEEIARKKTLGAAIELCAEAGGFDLDKQLQMKLGVDKGQFSRWLSGTEGIAWPKLRTLMATCGNDVPVRWMLLQLGYDLNSLRQNESALERQLRAAREENAALRRVLIGQAGS